MALDLYVGPISCYIAGDWKTIGQQMAEAQGIDYHLVANRAKPTEGAYSHWQTEIQRFLTSQGEGPMWNDAPDLPYLTDRPGWEGVIGLVLRYAYLLHTDGFIQTKAFRLSEVPQRHSLLVFEVGRHASIVPWVR